MNLLHRVRLLSPPARPSAQALFTAAVLAALVGLEIAGRMATSDLHDGVSALALFAVALAVSAWHKRRPLAWAGWVAGRARLSWRRLGDWKYDHGIDFRGTPPLPRKVPLAAWGLGVGLVAWGVAAVCVWYLLPGGWREVGVRTSYVLYLVALIAVWAALMAGLLAGLFVPVLLLDRWLRGVVSDSDRRSLTFFGSLAYLFVVTVAAAFLPAAGGLAVCLAAAVVATAWCARRPGDAELSILWRAAPYGGVYALPLSRLLAGGVLFVVLAYIDLVITGSSGRLLTHVEATDAMPLTGSLAALVAWTAPGLLLILGSRLWRGRRAHPSGAIPPTVHVGGALPPEQRDRAAAAIRAWGWNCRSGNRPAKRGDVKVELVEPPHSQATEFEPRWPLPLALDDLALPAVKDRLARRDEIQLRRRFFHGLRTLFKEARAERKARGGGYWFAPHWWFIDGLGREEPGRRKDAGGGLRPVGPPLSKVFGARARQHWYRVLRAARIDVVYVEDGVSAKAVERVLRTLLEVHDMHGGRREVTDHTFRGIPKVRVVVHDAGPDRTPAVLPHGYRQPKYDELSRLRVLHIFRDKGEGEEVGDEPLDFDRIPSPMLSV